MKIEIASAYIHLYTPQTYYEIPNASYYRTYMVIENPTSELLHCINSGIWDLKVDGEILKNMVVKTCKVENAIAELEFTKGIQRT